MITLDLPLAPTANNSYATIGRIRVVSKLTKAFRKEVWLIVKQARVSPLAGRLGVSIEIFPRDSRRSDIDNRVKPALDALTEAGVWQDDSQVDDLHVKRGEVVKDGAMRVTIRTLGE